MVTVSVIMSVYNNLDELPRAMASLLRQSYQNFEIIAIDDGSTDGSGAILDQYAAQDTRIKVIHQANTGLGPALHRACQVATGTYLARQDADDVSAPTRFERQVTYMEQRPDVVVCGTWAWFINPEHGPESSYEPPDEAKLLQQLLESGSNPLIHGSVMIRRTAYEAEGIGYRLRSNSQDFDLWLRLSTYGQFGIVKSVEYLYWLSVGGISYGNLAKRKHLVKLALHLHDERQTHGHELTDWQQEEAAIVESALSEGDSLQRETMAAYTRGLHQLKVGNWHGYREEMRRAAGGAGAMASKAQRHLQFAWMAPLLRLFYAYRYGKTQQRYLRSLEAGIALPEYVFG